MIQRIQSFHQTACRFVLTAALLCGSIFGAARSDKAQNALPYQDAHLPVEARVDDLLGRMTQDEKLSFLTGTGFTTQPIPRLGVPAMGMADAGQGVRGGSRGTQGPATAFPSGITMGSTWDPELVGRIGRAIGEEVQNKGTGAQVLLGPDVNIHRSPLGGRNGESFSEDPYLAARLAVGYIEGMQSSGAASCIKHFACNNEEVDRGYVDVKVDERALREIYLPAFEAGVREAHVWTLMSSYNQVNGFHSSANAVLLRDILKGDWGFDGLVMSDWGGVHETSGTVRAGNDLEMPGGSFLTHDKVAAALAAGEITQAEIDDSVRRILRTIARVGLLDGPKTPNPAVVNSPEHQKLTFQAAANGIVLLKNERSILPLDAAKIKSIAVIGPRAEHLQIGANGSPTVTPFYSVGPLEGITKRVGSGVAIRCAEGVDLAGLNGKSIPASALSPPAPSAGQGLQAEYFANEKLDGTPALTRTDRQLDFNWNHRAPGAGVAREHFSVRWTGKLTPPVSGTYTFSLVADDGCRLFLDGKPLIDHWTPDNGTPLSAKVDLVAGHSCDLRVEYYQAAGEAFIRLGWTLPMQDDFADAVNAARQSDVAVVFVGSNREGEGQDRPSLVLPGAQDALIAAVAAVNKRTIVVLNNGTPCLTGAWRDRVPALVEAWFPGQEGGSAIAAILFGDVNPSGKLPDTLAARREDYPDFGNFPGTKGVVHYSEGIYVGYRHFDKDKIKPDFPFGYGLSYTTFAYANLKLSQAAFAPGQVITATVDVRNTGARAGSEVVELYVHDPHPTIDKPVRELKGFVKVHLQPGETKTVTLPLDGRSFAYYDVPNKQWKADAGTYEIAVGASSRDIRQQATLRLTDSFTQHP